MQINVLKLCNATFTPQTYTQTITISTQTLSLLIISRQKDPKGLDMQNVRAYGSSGSSLCNIWTSALEYDTPKVTHTKKALSTGISKKEWRGVNASYKCAKGNCIIASQFVASHVRRMMKRRRLIRVKVEGCRVEGQGAAGGCVEDIFFSSEEQKRNGYTSQT